MEEYNSGECTEKHESIWREIEQWKLDKRGLLAVANDHERRLVGIEVKLMVIPALSALVGGILTAVILKTVLHE